MGLPRGYSGMEKKIQVKSEIGRLKKVLLKRPGGELEHLVPSELERLLFDDIPYLKTAQNEHDAFAEALRKHGAEVVYLEDLMTEVLKSDSGIKEQFIDQFIKEGGSRALSFREELKEYLGNIRDEKELVLKTMSGISSEELHVKNRRPLVELVQDSDRFILDPIPNLYFTRDPFAMIGNGVSLNRMFSSTRRRETIYGEYILNAHPDFGGDVHCYYKRTYPFSIEGGDILNLSDRVIAVGISQRTTPDAIELLAKNLFADEECEVETILALDIPNLRAFMHLDTVCTQLDRDKFLIHPGILGSLRVFEISKGEGKDALHVEQLEAPLDTILAEHLGLDRVSLIRCGGMNRVAAEREQWNDGSNVLAVKPGTVITYDRNRITNELLISHDINVIEIPSSELSRGRGGPRCMSMPLYRQAI